MFKRTALFLRDGFPKGRLRIHKGGLRDDDWDCEIDDDDEEKVRHLEGARA